MISLPRSIQKERSRYRSPDVPATCTRRPVRGWTKLLPPRVHERAVARDGIAQRSQRPLQLPEPGLAAAELTQERGAVVIHPGAGRAPEHVLDRAFDEARAGAVREPDLGEHPPDHEQALVVGPVRVGHRRRELLREREGALAVPNRDAQLRR